VASDTHQSLQFLFITQENEARNDGGKAAPWGLVVIEDILPAV
jgi:hypothetical protein